MNHSVIIPIPRKLDHNLWRLHLRKIIIAAGVALVSLIGGVGVALAANNGQLVGSGSISGEPLVGGSITFDISVINDPPGVGVFYQDRLYNLTGVVVLPPELTLDSCTVTPSSVLQDTPAAGYTEIRFDNIKNLEVNESVGLSCSATLNPIVDIGDTFTIDYRWEAYTNPCESCTGEWRYFPGPTDTDFAFISAIPQAIDIEKSSSTTTGEAQVNGAGGYEPAPAPGHGVGPDWPYTYTLTLTNNPLNPVNQVSVFDIIPPGVAYLGNDTVSCSVLGAPAGSTPARTLSDGSLPNTVDGSIVLEWNLETLFGPGTVLSPGETCTFSYQTAIPYRERRFADSLIVGGGPFSGPIVGGPDASHQNNYYATGDYEHPLNGDMPQIDGSIPGATPGDDAPVSVHSSYHSITKGASTSTVYQDTAVTYTVTGYISEYVDFTASAGTPYVITDLIPDGLEFCSTIAPGDTNGFYDECSFVATPALFNGAPLDPVSVALSGDDLLITWHITDPSAVQAGDTWTLTYRAIVRDFYQNGLPVSGLDVRPNSVEVEGEWNDLVSPPRTGTDTTGATTSIEVGQPMIDKRIWDPSTGTWVQGPVTLEIGQDLSYRIQLTFDEDLDMRNVIVDDFLPMAQRYIPSSALFDGSQGYGDTVPPFTPQAVQGQYSGTTYQVEAAQDLGNFHIDFCPYNDTLSRVDGNPSDPFLTVFENMVGGRQRLEWFLCRIDNSDTGTNIIWQVDFDGVVVDDTQIYNGCQVNNFGQLSGTNSFGTTYSLRDSLASVYAVPNLVMRKTNTAPDPLLAPGTFSYTLSVENDGGVSGAGNAYDWTIRDIIPPGLRVPTTAGSCNGFGTTAPGSYDCIADAGAQAGTGGFVTIRPIDGLGSHDPTRPIPPATTYDFTFQAEMTDVTPGATADEELFNTASVEYCTRPMPQDLDNDGSTDRRCEGYLADTIPHSDEGGTPVYDDFRDYTDIDDAAPNGPGEEDNTDTSRVHIVALAANKSHVAPVHISPQVAGDFATIGEVYQVSLEIGIPARTVLFNDPAAGYAEVIDTFAHEGAVFCDAGDGIAGCVDPAITQPGALATPDTVQSPAAPDWWQETNTSPSPGSTARFFLETIDNSAGSSAYTFTITFTMVVTGQNDAGNAVFFLPAANDIVSNSFVVRYFNDNPTPEEFTTTPAGDQIDIDQPHIATNKEAVSITRPGVGVLCNSAVACNSIQVQGNDTIAYQMTYTSDGESTAFDVSMIDWLTVYATYNSDMVCTSDTAPPVGGGVVLSSPAPAPYTTELLIDTTPAGRWDLPPGNRVTCTYTITVEPTVPAGTTLGNFTDADWSTLDGATIPDERIFDDSPNDGTQDEDTEILQVIVPVAGKTRLAPGPTGPGTQPPVRIGDVVDYRITIPLPIGRTQDIVISDYLDPGLIYYEGGTLTIRTNTLNPLTYTQTLNGSNDGIGAFSVDWAVWDPACIPVVGATNCIYNDGTNNTVVTVDFQAIVADVPLNLDGLVLDNDMQATFRDGLGNSGTITHGGAQDDEEVEITEPHLSLTKSAAPATVDAGDPLTYSVAITNDGTATAYDVSFDENLDDRTDYDTSYTMQCVHSVSGLLASEIDLTPFDGMPDTAATSMDTFRVAGDLTENSNGWDVAPGASITCTYRVTVLDTVVPGYTIDNIADADWSSLDGQVSGGPTEPNEREYDDSGSDATGFPAHTESDDQDTSTATVPAPTLVKDRTSGATVQPGQLVTYQIVVTVPESTISNLSITDTLPLPANAFRYEIFGSATSGWGGVLPAFSVQPAAGASSTLTWTFAGPITNPGDNNAANNTITLTYTVRVYSNATAGNNTNTARASYTNEAGGTSTTNTDTAVVNVIRPVNTTTKTASVATADAGDTITYTVTIRNNQAGTVAYDVYFNENLSNYTDYDTTYAMMCTHSASGALTFEVDDLSDGFDTTPDAFANTLDQFRIAGDLTEDNNPWTLAATESIVCTYRVIVLDSVQPGGTAANAIQNTITSSFDSADGSQAGEQDFASTVSRTVTVPAPVFTSKTRTSPVVGVDDTVQPGELVSYRIVLTLPEGTTSSLQIQDVLPAGFAFVSTDSVSSGWGGTLPAFSAQPAAGATGTLTWTFGAGVVNPGDNVANNTITLNYTVRVTAAAASTTTPLNNGNDAVNTGSASYDAPPAGGALNNIGSGTARVDVLRPAITVDKIVVPASGDAGDSLNYSVTLTNSGSGVAYDVYFEENLSDYTDYDTAYTMTCVRNPGTVALTYEMDDLSDGFDETPDAFAAALDRFRIAGDLTENSNPWMLDPGQSITCTYRVTIRDDARAGSSGANALTNSVTGTFDSADGDQPQEESLNATDTTSVSVPAPSFTKNRTSLPDAVQPGELVTYNVVITLPEGTTNGLIVADALPAGFEFVSLDAMTAGWGGALPGFASQPAAGATGTLIWTFNAGVVNPGDNIANNTLTLAYTVRVTATATSTTLPLGNGNDAVNTAQVFYTPPGGGSTSVGTDTAAVDVIRPTLVVAKSVTPTLPNRVDAGDLLDYSVTITNSGPGIAYDVYLDENLDDATDYVIPSTLACTHSVSGALTFEIDISPFDGSPDAAIATMDVFRIAGDLTENDNPWALAPGQSITCTYRVVLDQNVPASDSITNAVTGYGDTVDGNAPGEDTLSDGETVPAQTPDASIAKNNDASAAEYHATDAYAPGELAPYEIVVSVPEGSIADLVVCDNLPPQMSYESTTGIANSDGVTYTGVDYTILTAGFPAACPAGTDVAYQFASPLVLDDVPNADNTTAGGDFKTITIRSLARVLGTATDGQALTNTATLAYTRGDTGATQTDADDETINAVVVSQSTDKAITGISRGGAPLCADEATCNTVEVNPGDVLSYALTLTNTHATATAYDVTMSDDLPLHLRYDGNLACERVPGGPLATTPPAAGSDPILVDAAAIGTVNLAPAEALRCTYTATVQASVPAGAALTNTVTGAVTTVSGTQPGEATITDTGSDTATSASIDLELVKTVDDGTPYVGEYITFRLTLTNRGTSGATGVVVEDILPAGYAFDSASPADVYDNATGLWTVGALAAGGSTQLDLTVRVNPAGPYDNYAQVADADQSDTDSTPGDDSTTQDDDDTLVIDILPTVEVTKTANPVSLPEAGGPVTFTIEVHNTSPEPVTLTALTDSVFGNLNGQGTCATGGSIAAGTTYTCTFTRTITDPPGSTHANTVTATVQDAQSNTATDTDIETVTVDDIEPSIIIQKTAGVTTLNEPGGYVTFTVGVTNNSDEDNVLTVLIDDIFGNLNGVGTCATGGTIAARTTYTCSFTEPITETAGTVHVNEITGTLADDDGNSDTKTDDATVTILDVVQVTKAAGSPTVSEPGAPVTFTVQVRNTSLGPVTLTTLTDDVFGDLNGAGDCVTGGTISSGAAYSCTFTRTISGNAGFVHNDTITATVTDGGGNTASDTGSATVTVTDVHPTIVVSKTPNRGSLDEPGGDVTFTVVVTNNSAEPVTLTSLTDSDFGDLFATGLCVPPALDLPAGGGTYTCIFTQPVSGDVNNSHYNEVTATADDDEGNTATARATATVTFNDVLPSLTVLKTADDTTILEPGGPVNFTVTVRNGSPEPVTLVTLTDSVYGDLLAPGAPCEAEPRNIPVGGTYTCTFTLTITGDAGTWHDNTVTATVEDNEHNSASEQDSERVTIGNRAPFVTVIKTADRTTLTEPGGPVTFTVEVINGSPESVTLTTLTDDVFGDLLAPGAPCEAEPRNIPVGGTYSCVFTRTITGDADDSHVNEVTATVVDNEGSTATHSDDETVNFGDSTTISIVVAKTVDHSTLLEPGGPVNFTVTVRNDSPEPVTLLTLTDSVYGDLLAPGAPCETEPRDIAVGGTYTCTFTRTITGDADDKHTNTVTATVEDNEGNSDTESAEAEVTIENANPSIEVVKTVDHSTLTEPGGPVEFRIEVRNTWPEPVTLTRLEDDVFGDLLAPGAPCEAEPRNIPVGSTYTCTFTRTITGAPGYEHLNHVTAVVVDNEGNTDDDTDSATVTIQDVPPTIAVSKTPNRGSLPEPGGAVSFTVEVRNTSLVEALTLTALVDDHFGDLNGQGDCLVPQSIPVSGSYSCTFSGVVTGDVNASHVNEVTATARDDDGGSVSPSTTAEVTFTDEMPAIFVTKTAGVVSINEPGGNVTYTVEVRNDSVEPVTPTSLVDDVFGDLNGQGTCVTGGAIAVGGTYTCTFVGNVTGTVGSIHTNEVTGTATDNEGNTASYSGTADVLIADVIDVTKSPDSGSLPEPGGDVRFTVVVTNLTGTEITLDALVDDVFGDLDGVGTCDMPRTIAAGGNYACQFIPPITGNAGDTHTDTVTASVTDDTGNPASDTDSATVTITDVTPSIVVIKTANPSTVNEPGGDVTFTVDVENRSPEPVELTVLTDDVFGDLSGQGSCAVPQTIPARATYSCAFTRPITGSARATHHNEVTAGVRDDELHFITDTDDAVVTVNPTVDLELDKTVDDAAPNLGDTITFTLTLTNRGPSTATGVEVEDLLPSGYTFDSATPSQGAYDDATGLWAVGALTSGQTVTLDISVVVGPPGTYDNYAQVSATNEFDSDSTPGDDSTDEDDDAAVAVVPILGCISGALYLDTNRNGVQDTGEAPLANVRLRLYDGATLLGEVVTDAAGAYTFPNLPPGTYSVEIDQATLPAGVPIFLTPGNPRQDVVVSVGGTCAVGNFALVIVDPAITKSGSPSQASPGDTVVFSIQVTNTSATTAMNNIVVRDPLNGYFVFVSATTSQGSYTYDAVTHVVAFDLGTLNADATATMTITVRISASVARPASINNQASVSYQNGNPLSSQVVAISVPSLPGATVTPVPTTTPAPTTTVTATPTATTTGTGSGGSSGEGPTILPETGSRPAGGWSLIPILILALLLAVVGIGLCARLMRGQSRSQQVVLGAMMLLLIGMAGGASVLLINALPAAQLEISSLVAAQGTPSSALAGENPTPLPATIDETVGAAGAIDKQVESTATSTDLVAPMKLATRLLIPAIEVDAPIVRALVAGKTWDISRIYDEVAYLDDTAYPGGPGNAVLAGHVTHLRGDGPFLLLNRLAAGDIIVAEGDGAAYVYRVVWVKVTEKEDIEVTHPTESPMLTLITCVQWDRASYSYKKRLVVRAELIEQHEVRAGVTAPTHYSR